MSLTPAIVKSRAHLREALRVGRPTYARRFGGQAHLREALRWAGPPALKLRVGRPACRSASRRQDFGFLNLCRIFAGLSAAAGPNNPKIE